jgi:hypothetical protein
LRVRGSQFAPHGPICRFLDLQLYDESGFLREFLAIGLTNAAMNERH